MGSLIPIKQVSGDLANHKVVKGQVLRDRLDDPIPIFECGSGMIIKLMTVSFRISHQVEPVLKMFRMRGTFQFIHQTFSRRLTGVDQTRFVLRWEASQ